LTFVLYVINSFHTTRIVLRRDSQGIVVFEKPFFGSFVHVFQNIELDEDSYIMVDLISKSFIRGVDASSTLF